MATAASAAGAPAVSTGGGGNPFQLVTNSYYEKNNDGGTSSYQLSSSQKGVGGAINSGNYLRDFRLMVRTVTAGTGGTAATTSDMPWNILTQCSLLNVDGSEILYNMGGYSHYVAHKYSRPWNGDPNSYPDAANSTVTSPQFTLQLCPEIRWTAGVLANTDTRSAYRFAATIDSTTNVLQGGGGYTTAPTISVTGYLDAYAQPDSADLQGNGNQAVPPGLALQVKRRHQTFTLNAASSSNVMQSSMTGNALRCQTFVTRTTSSSTRSDLFTDPIQWTLDNRNLGNISTQVGTTQTAGGGLIEQLMYEFYSEYFGHTYAREAGVYVFPRFIKPGSLTGQGWLFTDNATKELFETQTSSNYQTSATAELISDEVYPVGLQVDPSLTDI